MSGLPDVARTCRIHTRMGFDVLVHRLPHQPRELVLDFQSPTTRPEVLVPVITGGPVILDPRVEAPEPGPQPIPQRRLPPRGVDRKAKARRERELEEERALDAKFQHYLERIERRRKRA